MQQILLNNQKDFSHIDRSLSKVRDVFGERNVTNTTEIPHSIFSEKF